jgi:type VI secretion system secreted protein Hcp
MMRTRFALVLAVFAGAVVLTAAVAPRDAGDDAAYAAASATGITAYLRVEGIAGGATARGYEGWIEVAAFELGVATAAGAPTGAARTTARPNFSPVTVHKSVDKATPPLAQACASGQRIPEAELVFFLAGATSPSGTVKLSDVAIVSTLWESGEEAVGLSYGRIEWSFVDVDPRTGRARGEVRGGWDLGANRPM